MVKLPADDDREAWRAKFVAYYESNAPSKVGMVTEDMMAKWDGKYSELYGKLEEKYGPLGEAIAPPAPARKGSTRGGGGGGVGDFYDEFVKLVADWRKRSAADEMVSVKDLDLVKGKVRAAENGLETSTFTVCARIRPVLEGDGEGGESFECVVPGGRVKGKKGLDDGQAVAVLKPKVGVTGRPKIEASSLTFDHCFGADAKEDDVFAAVGKPLVKRALDGAVGVIFAYGQTGSGKTHTMSSLMERVVAELFDKGEGNKEAARGVSFSYMELLGSDAKDCLSDEKTAAVTIGEMLDGRIVLKGLSKHAVASAEDMGALVRRAAATRTTAHTARNDASSRSHGIGIITVEPEPGSGCSLAGSLYLIDLAGSERAADSKDHDKQRLEETKAINLSLMALKECIRARTAASRPGAALTTHIPYRRAKLTQVMKDVFDPSSPRLCATVVLACVSPTAHDAAHSANTLGYAAPLRVAVAAAPHLELDPRDPALWDRAKLVAWVAETTTSPEAAAAMVVGDLHGVHFCALPEHAIFARCKAAGLAKETAAKLYSALWTAVVDAKTRNRRPDGTIVTADDEAQQIAQAAQDLKDKTALWAEREKSMRRGEDLINK